MLTAVIALVLGVAMIFLVARINSLADELRQLEMRCEEHDRKTDEDLYRTETWKAAANYRFDDDEKDIAELKSQCERYKGYIYRTTGEDLNAKH